jgi:aminopeptidase 2
MSLASPLRRHLLPYISIPVLQRPLSISALSFLTRKLSLTPDFSTFKFAGTVKVDLNVVEPTKSIVLNAVDLEFLSATVQNGGKELKNPKIEVDAEKQTATLEFDEELKVAENDTSLRIEFTGELNDKMAGFYRSSYIDKKTGEKKWLATTQMGYDLSKVN